MASVLEVDKFKLLKGLDNVKFEEFHKQLILSESLEKAVNDVLSMVEKKIVVSDNLILSASLILNTLLKDGESKGWFGLFNFRSSSDVSQDSNSHVNNSNYHDKHVSSHGNFILKVDQSDK